MLVVESVGRRRCWVLKVLNLEGGPDNICQIANFVAVICQIVKFSENNCTL